MSNKKEKVEFVRTEQFEAVEDELTQAMGLLDETNARIIELLNSESRGDLPFLNMPPETGNAPTAKVDAESVAAEDSETDTSVDSVADTPKKATPRVRRGRATTESTT